MDIARKLQLLEAAVRMITESDLNEADMRKAINTVREIVDQRETEMAVRRAQQEAQRAEADALQATLEGVN